MEIKREFMFRIYDKDETGGIPIFNLRNILSYELFVRSHWSEVNDARQEGLQEQQQLIRSSFSDRVLKDVMVEIMEEFDKDSNKTLDFDEFQDIVSDSDVDMLLGVY